MKPILKQIYQNSRFNNSETIKLIFDSFSKNEDVRYYVAWNPSTSISTLEFLSKDESKYVRRGVALNLSSSIFTLDYLSKDKSEDVRYWVARNPSYIKYKQQIII